MNFFQIWVKGIGANCIIGDREDGKQLFLTVGIASLLYQEHVPGLSIVLAGYGSVLLHSGADAYIVVSVGSFVTGVVFTLLGIRYRRYKTLHRPFSPDAADKASSQSLSDDQ